MFLAMFIVPFCVIGLLNKHRNNQQNAQDNASADETNDVSQSSKSA